MLVFLFMVSECEPVGGMKTSRVPKLSLSCEHMKQWNEGTFCLVLLMISNVFVEAVKNRFKHFHAKSLSSLGSEHLLVWTPARWLQADGRMRDECEKNKRRNKWRIKQWQTSTGRLWGISGFLWKDSSGFGNVDHSDKTRTVNSTEEREPFSSSCLSRFVSTVLSKGKSVTNVWSCDLVIQSAQHVQNVKQLVHL